MLKMGIIGMGKMGSFHADWILQNRDMKLVAVCEKNEKRTGEIRNTYKVNVYTDADEFLNREDLDFAVIVTTNDVHENMAVKAIESGVNVIVEKPMSVSYESALRMVKAAEKYKKHLFVHQSSRWDRDFLLVRDVLKSGRLGEVLSIQSKVMLCDEGWPAWGIDGMANPWRVKAQYFGGMLLDWGPHLVDQMLLLMEQDPKTVYGILQHGAWSTEVDDQFLAVCTFGKGAVFHIEASNNGRMPLPRWYVVGTRGTLTVTGKSEPFWDEAEISYVTERGKRESQKYTFYDICESGAEGGFYEDLVPFLKGKIKNFVSMHEASKVIKVLDLIRESSEKGKILPFV